MSAQLFMTLSYHLFHKMIDQAIKIGNALPGFRSHGTPHRLVSDNWAHLLLRFSVNIAKTFTFIFERMLAGGARPDCPLPPMSLNVEIAIPIPGVDMIPEEDAWATGLRHDRGMPPSMNTKLAGNTAEAWIMTVFGGRFRFGEDTTVAHEAGESGRAFFV